MSRADESIVGTDASRRWRSGGEKRYATSSARRPGCAAPPRHDRGATARGSHPRRLFRPQIAGLVTVFVVGFEVIDIDQQQPERRFVANRLRPDAIDVFVEPAGR